MAKRKAAPEKFNCIAEILSKKGLSQSWLAGELGVEFRTVNRYVNNHRQPSIEILFEIAQILKVNPKDLLNS
jgi:transcriptional regulator with XRE-family HTH domain